MSRIKFYAGIAVVLSLLTISVWILQSYLAGSSRIYHAWSYYHPTLPGWTIVAWITLGCLLSPGFQIIGAAIWVLLKQPFARSFLVTLLIGIYFFVHLIVSNNTMFYFPIWISYQLGLVAFGAYMFNKTSNSMLKRTRKDGAPLS